MTFRGTPALQRMAEPTRAAAYVRMSKESQEYSTFNQLTAIAQYAAAHSMEVIRVYTDEGISGLTFEQRGELKKLIETVESGQSDFSVILVYDVSRWGRFQDTDQSAYLEYLCKLNGVKVTFCAEEFEQDGSPIGAIIKNFKREDAARFSRDLSAYVFNGQANLARRGFDLGGGPPFGLKHLVVDGGKVVGELRPRWRKAVRTDRVVLAPGPPREIRIVREVFRRWVVLKETTGQIARFLNSKGFRTRSGAPWRSPHIWHMIQNEKYIGTQTYNITSCKLKSKRKRNDPSEWIRTPNAFKAIIEPRIYWHAQKRKRKRAYRKTEEEVLDRLRLLFEKKGRLTVKLVNQSRITPSIGTYVNRFGRLSKAYELVGYVQGSSAKVWQERLRRREIRNDILMVIRERFEARGRSIEPSFSGARFRVSGDLSGYIYIAARLKKLTQGQPKWRIRVERRPKADVYVIARLAADNKTVMDYYVVPECDVDQVPSTLSVYNSAVLHRHHVADLPSAVDRLELWLVMCTTDKMKRRGH